MKAGQRLLRQFLPFAVSVASLTWVIGQVDLDGLAAAMSWRVFLVMVPALLAYGAATLLLEARSIMCLIGAPPGFDAWTAARIKCASYLLAIVNYALGGAGLAVLLRKRAGLDLGRAASIVVLISVTDLVVVLLAASAAAGLVVQGHSMLRGGAVVVVALGVLVGTFLIRMPASLGPLERIRSLSIFDALRNTSGRKLAQLALLRCVFSGCFIAAAAACFYAFRVEVAPERLVFGMMMLAVIGALPIAVAGLGTGQIAAVYLFEGVAPKAMLVTLSLVLSAGFILLRAGLGLVFAREFTREVLAETREASA